MKLQVQVAGFLLVLVSFYYLYWFWNIRDVTSALLAVNFILAGLLILALPSEKWKVHPWFRETKYTSMVPRNGIGWLVTLVMVSLVFFVLLLANNTSQSTTDMILVAVPFLSGVIATWIAIQFMRS